MTCAAPESIVHRVKDRSFSIASRLTALVGLSALVLVVLGGMAGFAAEADAGAEPCVGCADCEAGDCGENDGHPATPHHHCCTTCCISHAAMALPAVASSVAPDLVESMLTPAAMTVAPRDTEAPYHPPRL